MEYIFFLSVLVLGRKICNGKLEMECESVGEWASEWVWFNYDGATARRQHKRQGEWVFRAVVWKWMPVILSLRGIAFLAFAVLLIAAFLSFLGSTCLPFLYNLGIPHQFNFRSFFFKKKKVTKLRYAQMAFVRMTKTRFKNVSCYRQPNLGHWDIYTYVRVCV